jgi:hypothetical protein
MAVVNIAVTQVPGTKVCYVPAPTIQQGDKVTWTNTTTDDVVLLFPHTVGLGSHVFSHVIAAGQTYHHLAPADKKNPAGPEERFRYALFCRSAGRFAVGGSDPEIIVM